jgi:hypothetical protein
MVSVPASGNFVSEIDEGVSMTTVSVGFIFAVSIKNVSSRKATSVMAVMSTNGEPRLGLCFGITDGCVF